MRPLSDSLHRGENNFDLIRLIAAFFVMFSHSLWTRNELPRLSDPLSNATSMEPLSSVGVYAFFIISGILVTQSFVQRNSPIDFVIARVARVWPGLIACATVTAFAVGPWMTNKPPAEYFSDQWTYAWWVHAVTLFGGLLPWLPGVFQDLRTAAVNVPLWTLPVELKCYLLVLILGFLGCLKTRRALVLSVLFVWAVYVHFVARNPHITFFDDMLLQQRGYRFPLVPFFLIGMLIYAYRDRIKLNGEIALILVLLFFILKSTPIGVALYYPMFYIAMVYGVLWAGTSRAMLKVKLPHDYSYGVYIYGFVVQQCVTTLFPSFGGHKVFAVTAPITLLIAAASWHLIEQPAINLSRRLMRRPPRPNEPVACGRARAENSGADKVDGGRRRHADAR